MSYMSGMMMGMAVGKGIRNFLMGGAGRGAANEGASAIGGNFYKMCKGGASRSGVPAFSLARGIPGRRRYYAASLVGNEALAEALESSLAKLDFVDEVKANPVSGSLLFVYHGDEAQMDAVAERLASRVFAVPPEGPAADAPTPFEEAADGLASFGKQLHGTFNAMNRHLKLATGGWFDLPSLLSLAFTVRGLQKILLAKQLPSGPQLLWWAFSILRGWRVA